jgi:hypothetical protein
MKVLTQLMKVQAPVIGTIERPELSAVNKNEGIAGSGLKISGSRAVYRDIFGFIHRFLAAE